MNIEEVKELQTEIQDAKDERAGLEGQQKVLTTQLLEVTGCKKVDEVAAYLEELTNEIDELNTKIDEAWTNLKEKYQLE